MLENNAFLMLCHTYALFLWNHPKKKLTKKLCLCVEKRWLGHSKASSPGVTAHWCTCSFNSKGNINYPIATEEWRWKYCNIHCLCSYKDMFWKKSAAAAISWWKTNSKHLYSQQPGGDWESHPNPAWMKNHKNLNIHFHSTH